jgi:putative transposase
MPIKTHYHNRLPHIAPIGATFFLTFRLADSLPRSIILDLREQFRSIKARLEETVSADMVQQLAIERKRLFGHFEHQLDRQPYGSCVLRQPQVAYALLDKFLQYDRQWYDLQVCTVMPNHVHALMDFSCQVANAEAQAWTENDYVQLDTVMRQIKGGSAFEINKLLGRRGRLWATDSYDHFVRDDEEWRRIEQYILQNPVKAGLVDDWEEWPFTYRR